MSPAATVNGDTPTDSPSSAFLSHLTSYPLISDSLQTLHSSPTINTTLSYTHKTYLTLTRPFAPYLHTPYQYISPYLSRADSLGDNTLSTIDSKFPVIKKPTGELYNDGKGIVFFPLTKGLEGKEYVFKTFDGEVKKVGGGEDKVGLVGKGKAAVSTGLLVTSDVVKWIGTFLGEKKEAVKEGVNNEKM